MAIYYVRKTGNDGTGNGTSGTPWLTIGKALTTVSAGGGHTINIGAGTYAENVSALNYLYCNVAFADWVVLQPENSGDSVIVTDTGGAGYCIRLEASSYLRFKDLTIQGSAYKSFGVISVRDVTKSHIDFVGCTITALRDAGGNSYCVYANVGTNSVTYLNFDSCVCNETGTGAYAYGLYLSRSNSSGTLDNITVTNCTVNVSTQAFACQGGTNLTVSGGTYNSSVGIGMRIGYDSGSVITTGSATISGAVVGSAVSHAFLVGWSAYNVTVQNCTINAGDHGLIFKECTDTFAYRNTINQNYASGLTALYFKAATNSTAQYNLIRASVGDAVKIGAGDTGNKCSNITLTNNKIISTGTSRCLNWGDSSADSGGGICDNNSYKANGTYLFGAVGTTSTISTLPALKVAWVGYGSGNNDMHSSLYGKSGNIISLLLNRKRKRG